MNPIQSIEAKKFDSLTGLTKGGEDGLVETEICLIFRRQLKWGRDITEIWTIFQQMPANNVTKRKFGHFLADNGN